MVNTLVLIFKDNLGKNISLTVRRPLTNLNATTIGTVMDKMIASTCIPGTDGKGVTSKVKYSYVVKKETELDVIS